MSTFRRLPECTAHFHPPHPPPLFPPSFSPRKAGERESGKTVRLWWLCLCLCVTRHEIEFSVCTASRSDKWQKPGQLSGDLQRPCSKKKIKTHTTHHPLLPPLSGPPWSPELCRAVGGIPAPFWHSYSVIRNEWKFSFCLFRRFFSCWCSCFSRFSPGMLLLFLVFLLLNFNLHKSRHFHLFVRLSSQLLPTFICHWLLDSAESLFLWLNVNFIEFNSFCVCLAKR